MPSDEVGLKILTSPPIYDLLYDYCTPGMLQRLARTCSSVYGETADYLRHTFSIRLTKQLARFFGDNEGALAFRQLQARLEFLICGSQALQLMDRTTYENSDLDLYISRSHTKEVGEYLLAAGYTYIRLREPCIGPASFEDAIHRFEDLDSDDYPFSTRTGEFRTFTFRKRLNPSDTSVPLHEDSSALQVQVVAARRRGHLFSVVLQFHSTVVMNFIAWDRAVSMYPRATFERREGLLNYDKKSFSDTPAIEKYESRGFRIRTEIESHDFTRSQDPMTTSPDDGTAFEGAIPFGPRFVGDGNCWTVKLDTTNLQVAPGVMRWSLEANSWSLSRSFGTRKKLTKFENLRSGSLKHVYSVTREFHDFLKDLLIDKSDSDDDSEAWLPSDDAQ
ncbi:hypothetical protein BKA62DRAFT_621259 [Auriculariales sp. MPI-PUGE-AT-0066]|nr:hypothetical protein BKA62DRAFT_621259 [Auriculariales sp. MPI-PUGE-AT-0066]